MNEIPIRRGFTIPAELLSTAYTRALAGDEDAAVAARKTPSVVELRFDTRGCPGLASGELERLLAYRPLRADSRGTLRVTCGEFASRDKNLVGARDLMRMLVLEALGTPVEAMAEAAPSEPRRGPGLIKRR